MPYSYKRTAAAYTPYADSLTEIQTHFVGTLMEGVYDYVLRLHKRLGARHPWDELSFFESWDYGHPRTQAPGIYEGRVWMKSGSVPNLGSAVDISVKFDNDIQFSAKTELKHLITGRVPFQATAEKLSLEIGERWERELTGHVEWANDERD